MAKALKIDSQLSRVRGLWLTGVAFKWKGGLWTRKQTKEADIKSHLCKILMNTTGSQQVKFQERRIVREPNKENLQLSDAAGTGLGAGNSWRSFIGLRENLGINTDSITAKEGSGKG